MDQSLDQYLRDRPWYQLRRLALVLGVRVEGDARRHAVLRASISAHAQRQGLTREQARQMAEQLIIDDDDA